MPFLKASLLYRSSVFSQLQDFNGLLMELIADIFGSKKGLIRHYYYKCLLIFGAYKQYQTVDWHSVNFILVIVVFIAWFLCVTVIFAGALFANILHVV